MRPRDWGGDDLDRAPPPLLIKCVEEVDMVLSAGMCKFCGCWRMFLMYRLHHDRPERKTSRAYFRSKRGLLLTMPGLGAGRHVISYFNPPALKPFRANIVMFMLNALAVDELNREAICKDFLQVRKKELFRYDR